MLLGWDTYPLHRTGCDGDHGDPPSCDDPPTDYWTAAEKGLSA